jgi:hypothetical protein
VEKALAEKENILWSTFMADSLNMLGATYNQIFEAKDARELGYMQGRRDAFNFIANYVSQLEQRLAELEDERDNPISDEEDD